MSNSNSIVEVVDTGAEVAPPTTGGVAARRRRFERGMVTAEYAVGIMLIIVIAGVMFVAIRAGWFQPLVQNLVSAIFKTIQAVFVTP